MEVHSIIYVIAIIIMVLFSAFFSATEAAFSTYHRTKMKTLAEEGNKKAEKVLALSEDLDGLVAKLLLCNVLINTGIAVVGAVLGMNLMGPYGAFVSIPIVGLILLLFGELTPRDLAGEEPEKFVMEWISVLSVVLIIIIPLAPIVKFWKFVMTKAFKLSQEEATTEEELLIMVENAEIEGGIDSQQSELIQNAIEFNDLEAYDVLTPRVDIVAVEIDAPKEEIAEVFFETGYSRLPVYQDSLDKIIGIINQKDFYNYVFSSDKNLSEYVKPIVFMAGTVKASNLLRKMQKVKTHMAIIVDEYGGTEGLVTMEDIIEELVGEIFDEHDEITTQEVIQMQDGTYRVLANANLEKMFGALNMEEDHDFDATTVNGWVMIMLNKLPEVGDTFVYEDLEVKVTRVEKRKSAEINIRRLEPTQTAESQ